MRTPPPVVLTVAGSAGEANHRARTTTAYDGNANVLQVDNDQIEGAAAIIRDDR